MSQLTSAVTAWGTANQGNNSGVRFQPADANHPATLTFKNDLTAGTLPPGKMTPGSLNPDGTIKTATITFNLGATTTDAAGQTIPVYWPSFTESFGTFHKKVTLHEVGEAMA